MISLYHKRQTIAITKDGGILYSRMQSPETHIDYTAAIDKLGVDSTLAMDFSLRTIDFQYQLRKMSGIAEFAVELVDEQPAIGPPIQFTTRDNAPVRYCTGEKMFIRGLEDPAQLILVGTLRKVLILRKKYKSPNAKY